MENNLLYEIGLTLLPGIGVASARKLIAYFGSAENVFRADKSALMQIQGMKEDIANQLLNRSILKDAATEIKFINRYKIQTCFYRDSNYPFRLKACEDAPIIIYYKGVTDLNASRIVSIVGTRKASAYGKSVCRQLIQELIDYEVVVVSGLAYGIDISAHKAALEFGIPTVGVLAHGLDTIYPALHRTDAEKMLKNGGLLTEFIQGTPADKHNFPKRNRIIAGLADVTIVVESSAKGGSLITADIANSYDREVGAFPGRVGDKQSIGCNELIKTNKAHLIESAADLVKLMNWDIKNKTTIASCTNHRVNLEVSNLSVSESAIINILQREGKSSIDDLFLLMRQNGIPLEDIPSALLNLELMSLVRVLPGKIYECLIIQ